METIFKTLALSLLVMTLASCEKHDLFDENTITGAVGPEAYWTTESDMVKAGESMGFTGQYYSTVDSIDHSEVWYELFEKEDKTVTASLISAFTYSVTSNTTIQRRVLQTIQSYPHSEDMWSDSLHAYVIEGKFPVSYTLSPFSWVKPKDTVNFEKNLHDYFGVNFAKEFKEGLTRKMHSHDGTCDTTMNDTVRNYAAYMQVLEGLFILDTVIVTPNGDKLNYRQWMSDSTFNENQNKWEKFFKKHDTIWSKTLFDTLGMDVELKFTTTGRPPKQDTTWYYDTTYLTKPLVEKVKYVYPQIVHTMDSIWNNHVSFYDLIQGTEGYSIEYVRNYYINAELRVYDKRGIYSKTDSKEITIN
jgi:hypothetical protein